MDVIGGPFATPGAKIPRLFLEQHAVTLAAARSKGGAARFRPSGIKAGNFPVAVGWIYNQGLWAVVSFNDMTIRGGVLGCRQISRSHYNHTEVIRLRPGHTAQF
jgi:hypothetical protein